MEVEHINNLAEIQRHNFFCQSVHYRLVATETKTVTSKMNATVVDDL